MHRNTRNAALNVDLFYDIFTNNTKHRGRDIVDENIIGAQKM